MDISLSILLIFPVIIPTYGYGPKLFKSSCLKRLELLNAHFNVLKFIKFTIKIMQNDQLSLPLTPLVHRYRTVFKKDPADPLLIFYDARLIKNSKP